jgi:hypothetical protein
MSCSGSGRARLMRDVISCELGEGEYTIDKDVLVMEKGS